MVFVVWSLKINKEGNTANLLVLSLPDKHFESFYGYFDIFLSFSNV